MTWVDISVCFSVFRVYVLGLSFTSPGYGLGAYLILGYVPGYRSSSSLLITKQVCLSLKSGGLFSHSDQVFCVLFCLILFLYLFLPLSLISLLNKEKKIDKMNILNNIFNLLYVFHLLIIIDKMNILNNILNFKYQNVYRPLMVQWRSCRFDQSQQRHSNKRSIPTLFNLV